MTQLSVNKDGSLVASAAADNSIRVWETESGKPRALNIRLEGDDIRELAFAPDLPVLAVLQTSTLTLIAADDGAVVALPGVQAIELLHRLDPEGRGRVAQTQQGGRPVHQDRPAGRGPGHQVALGAINYRNDEILVQSGNRLGAGTGNFFVVPVKSGSAAAVPGKMLQFDAFGPGDLPGQPGGQP